MIRSSAIAPEVIPTPPTLPGFYPHSDGPLPARCALEFDLKPRSITTMMGLGCWGIVSKRTKQICVSPLRSGRLGYRRSNSVAQRLIDFAARSEPMQ